MPTTHTRIMIGDRETGPFLDIPRATFLAAWKARQVDLAGTEDHLEFKVLTQIVFQDDSTGEAWTFQVGELFSIEPSGWRDPTPEEEIASKTQGLAWRIEDAKLSLDQIEEIGQILDRIGAPSTGRSRYEILSEEPLI